MTARSALLGVFAAAVLAAAQGTASACPGGRIHLAVQVGAPRFGDQNDLIYQVDVVNAGPDRATGLLVGQSTLMCATVFTPLVSCQRVPPITLAIADLDPGARDTFPVQVLLATEGAVVVRSTVQVLRADQRDTASVLGGCRDGQCPQDSCDTRVTVLSP